jgi:7-carboxy-7-deazaguanine synthase
MKITELFTSIQGESSFTGMPCFFIRLSGCNLRCSYCDTAYAYDDGYEVDEKEIVRKIGDAGLNLVEITGGEPLLQDGVSRLMTALIEEGRTVLLETNGSRSIRGLDRRAVIILDIKTPGSGMSDRMDFSNLDEIGQHDEVKFVVTARNDYEWAKDVIGAFSLTQRCGILVSPAFGFVRPEDLARWMIDDRLPARLNLQLHKYIFDSERRGV